MLLEVGDDLSAEVAEVPEPVPVLAAQRTPPLWAHSRSVRAWSPNALAAVLVGICLGAEPSVMASAAQGHG